jgi:hypothetical protein
VAPPDELPPDSNTDLPFKRLMSGERTSAKTSVCRAWVTKKGFWALLPKNWSETKEMMS